MLTELQKRKLTVLFHHHDLDNDGYLDSDGDGYLSTEECLEAVEEFHLSDDPDAPANWLLGPH